MFKRVVEAACRSSVLTTAATRCDDNHHLHDNTKPLVENDNATFKTTKTTTFAVSSSNTKKKKEPHISSQTQTPPLPLCGSWCKKNNTRKKCRMDTSIIPCKGPYCETNCSLWSRFVLGSDLAIRALSCDEYKAGIGYSRGAVVCDDDCLIPEISPKRYPMPTGLGIMCQPGTCSPSAAPSTGCPENISKKLKGLTTLQCPCNWFGSECTDDWIPVQSIQKTANYGPIQATTIIVPNADWKKIIGDHKPGGVVRLAHRDTNGVPCEMAAVVVDCHSNPGQIEILTSPSDKRLRKQVRSVTDKLRNMESGIVTEGNLYVNPIISGFFNRRWRFLMDVLQDEDEDVQHVVVVSSGTGLGGALSTAEAVWSSNKVKNKDVRDGVKVHVYYGLRNIEHLPYRGKLEELIACGAIDLTLIVSGKIGDNGIIQSSEPEFIQEAVRKGELIRKANPGEDGSMYVQNAVGRDLSSSEGKLKRSGANFRNTVFVVCGRSEILFDTPAILEKLCNRFEDKGACSELMEQIIFTNI